MDPLEESRTFQCDKMGHITMDLTYGQYAIRVGMHAAKARNRIMQVGFLNKLKPRVDSVTLRLAPFALEEPLDDKDALRTQVSKQVNRLLSGSPCRLSELTVTSEETVICISRR